MVDDSRPARRGFLGRLALLVGGALGAAMTIPAVATILHPILRPQKQQNAALQHLGSIQKYPLNRPQKVSITATVRDGWQTTADSPLGSVWVVRTAESPDEWVVLSNVCPHMGCAISHSEQEFVCPCHGARFDKTGARLQTGEKNPSPRDMDRLDHLVENGELFCEFRRFQPGRSEKVEQGS